MFFAPKLINFCIKLKKRNEFWFIYLTNLTDKEDFVQGSPIQSKLLLWKKFEFTIPWCV